MPERHGAVVPAKGHVPAPPPTFHRLTMTDDGPAGGARPGVSIWTYASAVRPETGVAVVKIRFVLSTARSETLVLPGWSCQIVDLVIEFQTDDHVAPIVAAKYREANIPLIAIEVPHPGATYFGANNYEAGLIGGRYLGRWAKQHWHGG